MMSFLIYYMYDTNNLSQTVVAEVIAYFKSKQNEVIHIHEQVNLVQGNYHDID
jgi:hypothetical protein